MGPQTTQNPPPTDAPGLRHPGRAPESDDTSLAAALATLRKRLWVLILAVLLGASYGFYKAYTQPKIYEAESTIQVHNGASAEYKLNGAEDYGGDSQTKMNTEVAILTSDTLLYTVAKEMNLANNPDFYGPAGGHLSMDDPLVRAGVVGSLRGGLRVTLVPRTELMSVGYSSLSPKLAADIVNRVVADYIQRSFRSPYSG